MGSWSEEGGCARHLFGTERGTGTGFRDFPRYRSAGTADCAQHAPAVPDRHGKNAGKESGYGGPVRNRFRCYPVMRTIRAATTLPQISACDRRRVNSIAYIMLRQVVVSTRYATMVSRFRFPCVHRPYGGRRSATRSRVRNRGSIYRVTPPCLKPHFRWHRPAFRQRHGRRGSHSGAKGNSMR